MGQTIVTTLDEKVWREFVLQHPQGNIFHTPEMFQVFSKSRGYQPELRAVLDDEGRVWALLPTVRVTLRGGLLRRLTTRSIAYGGTLCKADEAGKQALSDLLCAYKRTTGREVLFTELRHQSDASDYRLVFSRCGFQHQDHLNYLIDLTGSEDEVFGRIGARTRKHIRREQKKNQIAVSQVQQFEQVKIVYDLLLKSYHEAQVPIADISLFENAFKVLHPLNMVKFWLVQYGDEYIASSVELVYKEVVYGWYGGVNRAYSQFNPSELLTWEILKWSAENGYRIYDFGGAGTPDKKYGVRDFKSKFGGQLVCYGRNTCTHVPVLLWFSKIGYNVLRRFIRN